MKETPHDQAYEVYLYFIGHPNGIGSMYARGIGEPTYIVTKPFLDAFANVGGAGATFSLILALLISSKREDEKLIAKLSFTPGLFNINEPLMFGLPVVLNPVYIIPIIIAPIITTMIAYFATAMGLINKTIVLIPWTTPPVLSAYLATGNDYRAAILSVVLIAISTLIFIPFVMISNKMLKK